MIEFIKSNVPWIFSGVGIPLALGTWLLLRKLFARSSPVPTIVLPAVAEIKTPVPAAVRNPPTEPRRADPFSAEHMIATVSSAAPLARDHVKQQFIGVPVQWVLPFYDARKPPNHPIATVYFSLPDCGYEVRCEASIENYPFLRFVPVGQLVRILGSVGDVSSVDVLVRDVHLTPVLAESNN